MGGPDRVGGIAGMPTRILGGHDLASNLIHHHHFTYGKNIAGDDDGGGNDHDDELLSPSDSILDEDIVKLAITAIPIFKPPTPRRIPRQLKLQTSFDLSSKATNTTTTTTTTTTPVISNICEKVQKTVVGTGDQQEEDEDRTARPLDRSALQTWNNRFTIDQVLSSNGTLSPNVVAAAAAAGQGNGSGNGRGESVRGSARSSAQALGPITPNASDDISPITRGEWGFMMVDNALNGGRTVTVETC